MRSIYISLQALNDHVVSFLDELTSPIDVGMYLQWNVQIPPLSIILYVNLFNPPPQCVSTLQLRFKDTPFVHASVDVSGRLEGTDEVKWLVHQFLTRFDGYAFDEYTSHPWTLSEIEANSKFLDHTFFDYRGCTDEERKRLMGDRQDT